MKFLVTAGKTNLTTYHTEHSAVWNSLLIISVSQQTIT